MGADADMLLAMYHAMRRHFGQQNWWPGDTPLEICLGAILTQNTNWRNVEKALANLRRAGALSLRRLHGMDVGELARLIRPAGYFNVKARRLKSFVGHVVARHGGRLSRMLARPAGALREELLGVHGIGRETADSILLYAAGRRFFVIDAYTLRIGRRHGLFGADADYESARALFESALPANVDLWNDYHAQFVAVGKQYCKPTARCEGCPLGRFGHDASL